MRKAMMVKLLGFSAGDGGIKLGASQPKGL